MRALSLHQPWASLWLTWCKVHETRPWEIHHRGSLLVHAAKKRVGIDMTLQIIADDEFGRGWEDRLPRGAIIGSVNIQEVRSTAVVLKDWGVPPGPVAMAHWTDYQCGDYAPRRFAFQRGTDVIRLAEPIPYRGQQGPFDVPFEIVQVAIEQAKLVSA